MPSNAVNDENFADRGLTFYETKLKLLLEPKHDGEFVAIHVDTEDYELGKSSGDAMRAMRQRRSEGRLVILQVGSEPEWGLAARLLAGKMIAGQQK
jgi:hypothetical protein